MSSIIRVKMSILRKKGFKIWIYDPSHEQHTCNDPVITFKILFLELKFDINKICQVQMYSEMFILIVQPPPALSPLNTLLNQPQDLGKWQFTSHNFVFECIEKVIGADCADR